MNEKLKKFERYLLQEMKRCCENHYTKDEMLHFYTGSISALTDMLKEFYHIFGKELD